MANCPLTTFSMNYSNVNSTCYNIESIISRLHQTNELLYDTISRLSKCTGTVKNPHNHNAEISYCNTVINQNNDWVAQLSSLKNAMQDLMQHTMSIDDELAALVYGIGTDNSANCDFDYSVLKFGTGAYSGTNIVSEFRVGLGDVLSFGQFSKDFNKIDEYFKYHPEEKNGIMSPEGSFFLASELRKNTGVSLGSINEYKLSHAAQFMDDQVNAAYKGKITGAGQVIGNVSYFAGSRVFYWGQVLLALKLLLTYLK